MSNRNLRLLVHGILGILFFLSMGFFIYQNAVAGTPVGFLVINTITLAIPLGLLFFCIGLMFEAWMHKRQGGIGRRMANFLYRTPRFAGLAVVLFTGMFALDAFDAPGSPSSKMLGFLIHAMPAIIMAMMLAVAWRRAWVGTFTFGLAALFFLRFVFPAGRYSFGNLLLFVLPMAVVAALFWLNWKWKEAISGQRTAVS